MFKKILVASILGAALISCSAEKKETQVAEQPKAEWIDMFNGENLEDWTAKIYHHESGDNYQICISAIAPVAK